MSDLERLLARPALARLWTAARERLERLGGARGSIRLGGASEEERAAIADLVGLRTLPGETVRLRLDQLDRALRSSRFAVSLEQAMATVGGPLRDLPAEKAREAERWRRLWLEAREHPAVAGRAELEVWLADLESTGLLRRLGAGRERALLDEALSVLALLPADGARLAVLANEALGSSHALDAGRPAATLVLRALAAISGSPSPTSAAERRELWERFGVVCDDLTSDVLALGVAPAGGGLVGEWLRAFAAAGEPVRLTLRQLASAELELPAGTAIHVCENPAVVAVAADRLGASSAPLVCGGGFPSAAVLALLEKLRAGGAKILYHGDFDWPGLQIANTLARRVPLRPWRFEAADYLRAVECSAEAGDLTGASIEASWDLELTRAMAAEGKAIEEEAVLEDLLADLAEPSCSLNLREEPRK